MLALSTLPGPAPPAAAPGTQHPVLAETSLPDEWFDVWLPLLSAAALRVLLYIARRTRGFAKPADAISLDQFQHGIVTATGRRLDAGTGLSRPAILAALSELQAHDLIRITRRTTPGGRALPTLYTLSERAPTATGTEGLSCLTPPAEELSPFTPPALPVVNGVNPQESDSIRSDSDDSNLAHAGEHDTAPRPPLIVAPALAAQARALTARLERGLARPPAQAIREARATAARVLHLWQASGLDEARFAAHLATAEARTAARLAAGTVRRPLAYFFAVLDTLLMPGALPDTAPAARRAPAPPPTSPAGPPPTDPIPTPPSRPPKSYSAYLAAILTDHSQELGDADHTASNIAHALRRWQQSGLPEAAFAELLHTARARVRRAQGAQGAGQIVCKMAYYFAVLVDLLRAGARPAVGPPAGLPAPSQTQERPPGPLTARSAPPPRTQERAPALLPTPIAVSTPAAAPLPVPLPRSGFRLPPSAVPPAAFRPPTSIPLAAAVEVLAQAVGAPQQAAGYIQQVHVLWRPLNASQGLSGEEFIAAFLAPAAASVRWGPESGQMGLLRIFADVRARVAAWTTERSSPHVAS